MTRAFMSPLPSEKELSTGSRIGLGLALLLACYAYLWLFVQPRLIYDGFGTIVLDVPVFATGRQPLRDALRLPGGLVVYAYGFLSQGFHYSWLGALLIVLVALCLAALARLHYVRAGHSSATVLSWLPAIGVLLLYSHYDHPLPACLTLALGLSFSLVFERVPMRWASLRGAVFCCLAGMSYWLGGAGATYVFALLTIICLLLRRAWPGALLVLPATVAIIWALADYVFYLSPRQAFMAMTPFCRDWAAGSRPFSRVLIVLLYAFVPATVPLLHLSRMVVPRGGNAGIAPREQNRSRKTRAIRAPRRAFLMSCGRLVWPALPAIVLIVGLCGSHDGIHRQIVVMNALARQGRWAEVLERARRLPQNVYSIYANHDIDRALYHTGRLPYDMFAFPQNPHALLLTHEQDESCMTQLKMCDMFIELGNVDLAEKLACEFLVAKGHLGLVLEKLAWINIIKGQGETARVYLEALKKDLIYRDRAAALLSGLEHGFGPREAADIRRLNSYIRRRDSGRLHRESIGEMLTGLLEQNPHNRMAFEYLMACYLLAGQVDKVTANMGRLEGFGYHEIPTLYEEAMLIYYAARRQPLDPDKLAISRVTIRRYERFLELNNLLRAQNRAAVLQQLVREFGTSYFFYFRFTLSRPTVRS